MLKSYLASIPIYLLSMIRFPKWAVEYINSQMANFLWHDADGKHKYHLSNCHNLAKKDHGGWGIPDISNINLCLFASWINRYHLSDNVIRKKLLIINITMIQISSVALSLVPPFLEIGVVAL